jgi:FAD/FMN-containing dehydrogenase
MNEPSYLYANRDPGHTDILHEYFVPVDRLGEFVDKVRPILLKHHADLLNITIRNVESDPDSFLRYAREEVFGLVFLFNQSRSEPAERAMKELTRELVDAALACGGTYYLPYRAHPTREQFQKGYPQVVEFFSKKRTYDPDELFQNEFYLNYRLVNRNPTTL